MGDPTGGPPSSAWTERKRGKPSDGGEEGQDPLGYCTASLLQIGKGMKHLFLAIFLLTSCSPILSLENPFEEVSRSDEIVVKSDPPLKIIAIDVGQGDATLVIGPNRRSLLIDGGPEGSDKIIRQIFLREGIIEPDWALLSHYDIDHIGGIPGLLESFSDPPTLIDRGMKTDQDHPLFTEYLKLAGDRQQEAVPGESFDLGDGASAQIIIVNGQYIDGKQVHLNPDEENAASIGVLVTYGDFEYLTLGDLPGGGSPGGYPTKNLEDHVAEIVGDIDVLHLSHHGSETSNSEYFLKTTRPENAVISVGADNDYGHPAPTILNRLEQLEIPIFRSDQHGTIRILSEGDSFEIQKERKRRLAS
ncbi:MAG: MBL fold metallo-hydrolase [Deltaproteobacteria bacterium]|nr:MBL fold metallo-hydrolase [Deltaproteobacteria bacterium]